MGANNETPQMKEIVIWTIITVMITITSLIVLIVGFVKKKRRLFLPFFILMAIALSCGVWTVYLFTSKSFNRLTDILEPRKGNEIYEALFGKPTINCIKVLEHQDQVIPKIDYAILLHFETCPEELKRILSLHEFKAEVVSSESWEVKGASISESWFRPETLGDARKELRKNCRSMF